MKRHSALLAWGAAVVLVACGLLLPSWMLFSLTVALARGLVVLGLMVLWRTGLVSFGHALYFALGAYTFGLGPRLLGTSDTMLLVLAGAGVSVGVSVVVGLLLVRYRLIFFAMLSLAFSMIFYGLLVKISALGSTDGFNVSPPQFFGTVVTGEDGRVLLYGMTCAFCLCAAAIVRRHLLSPLGRLDAAIRDNEVRVQYLGYSAQRAIYLKYLLSAGLAGAGGALTAVAIGHIDPQMSYWTTSGEFVFVTVLSGPGHVAAPFLGSIAFEIVRTLALGTIPHLWKAILGGCLLAVILFLPGGLWSLFRRRTARRVA